MPTVLELARAGPREPRRRDPRRDRRRRSPISACPSASARCAPRQLWHWIYHRGVADFAAMRNIARPLLEKLGRALHAWRGPRSSPSRSPPTARASGCCGWRAAGRTTRAPRSSASTSRRRDRGTLCVSSQVGCTLNCTFCHTGTQALGAQPDRGRDRRPGAGRARRARRIRRRRADRRARAERARACARSPTSCSWAWASRSTISTACATPST